MLSWRYDRMQVLVALEPLNSAPSGGVFHAKGNRRSVF